MGELLRVLGPAESDGDSIEEATRQWGHRLFALMDRAEPRWFHRQKIYGALMDWTMRDDRLKAQVFRFIDVLPSLSSSSEISRHFQEYLGEGDVPRVPGLALALKASRSAPSLAAMAIKKQVAGMARQFILGDTDREIVAALRRRRKERLDFTVDILGETVVSDTEADRYAQRYLALIELLSKEELGAGSRSTSGNVAGPALNVSVKISALCAHIQPADPNRALDRISERLRPILRLAKDVGALINLDMEQYTLKDLTLELFKRVFAEPEFASGPACGLALQAYLRDSERDLVSLLSWVREHQRPITVRLVKGAYWDYESVMAAQKGWPSPVFTEKAATDASFERLSVLLLENHPHVTAAFGSHNVRSIAYALAHAQRSGLTPDQFEFQMLLGMADPAKAALVELGYRVREYCPIGQSLPGMAYLVRRLLENSSNEGFLTQHRTGRVSRDELLAPPISRSSEPGIDSAPPQAGRRVTQPHGPSAPSHARQDQFRNMPPADFAIAAQRAALDSALHQLRPKLGQRHPLVINHQRRDTAEWLPSLNPANQQEVIGHAAQANLDQAGDALTAACNAAPGWARTPAPERAELIERLADLLARDRAVLSALEILEAGKSWTEADADVVEAIDFCRFYSAVMRDMAQPHSTQCVPGESNVQHGWPRGVGLIIAPWNFPLAILTGMTVAALVTGNTVIMKPSDQTPVIASRLMDLLIESGLPPGVVNLLTGPGATVGAHLVAHARIDFIAFTGSKEVGLRIWESAGRTVPGQRGLKRVICEMGGKNALIVDSDADLDEAVSGAVASAFAYSGQKCSALSRLIVLADAYDRFMERLIAATASLPIGPAEAPGAVLVPVISRQAQTRILATIEQGKGEARLAWQGRVPDDPNACYVPPSIFTEVRPGCRLFQEEIFGPVLAVTRADDFGRALDLANASEFALTGGLYSRSPVNIQRAKAEFVCGNLYINRPITGAIVQRQPFGGFKMSGGGTKAGGREYLENFLLPRVITENQLRHGFAPSGLPARSPIL